ncbi:MAG: peptide deformylase [Planctomycetaceae bacterium]
MEIVQYPHPALTWKAKPITEINARLRTTVEQMFELMYTSKGLGLAANQVALPFQVFVVNPTGDPEEKDQEFVFINPEITSRKGSVEGEEGCLSLPDVYGEVRRAEQIVVEAYDLSGQGFELNLTELPARVVQHEADHLQGVMFLERMTEAALRELQPQLELFESHYRSQQAQGKIPDASQLLREWRELEPQ